MKDLLSKVFDFLSLDHMIVFLVSLASAILSSARNDGGMPIIPRTLNTLSGLSLACLSGYILLEYGWMPWFSSGISYLVGHVGNRLMNALLVAAKMAEIDPFSTVGKVIGLIWSWKVPTISNGSK